MTEETAGTPRTDEVAEMLPDAEVIAGRLVYMGQATERVSAEFARQLEREVAALTTQRDEAEALSYVPGAWQCAKCNLRLIHTNLHVPSGTMSANNEPQQCANGCGPMWRVSERDDRQDAQRQFIAESEKFESHTKAVAEWTSTVAEIIGLGEHGKVTPDQILDQLIYGRQWASDMQTKLTAAEAQRDELQKRIGYAASDKTCESLPVVEDLLALAEALYYTLEDSEQISDDKHLIQDDHFRKLVEITERLDALPDDRPGYTMSYPGKAKWALRFLTATAAIQTIDDLYDIIVAQQESMDEEGQTDEQAITAVFDRSCEAIRRIMAFRKTATGTTQATECETNGTEGLRAELDAAKRALVEMDVRPSQITVTSLFRCLERLHLAVKGCARIGFEESSPTRNALHFNVWNDLNAAQADAALKLKMFAALAAESTKTDLPFAKTSEPVPERNPNDGRWG